MARKQKGRKSKTTFSKAIGIQNILQSETTDFILGLLMLAMAICVVLSMASYISTGGADQSILEHMKPGEWLNTDKVFSNYCGSWGAILAYYLMTVNLGFPAFLIPVFFILASLKLMRIYSVNLWKAFLCLAVTMVWTSVAMAKFLTPVMGSFFFCPGGGQGLYCVQRLEALVGPPGLTALLIVTAIIFLTYLSTETIGVVRRILNPVRYVTGKVRLTVTDGSGEAQGQADAAARPLGTDAGDGAVAADAGDGPEGDEDAEDDTTPTVVDLTDMALPESAATMPAATMPAATPATPATARGDGADGAPSLRVDAGKQESAADGKTLTTHYDLHTPINPWEPYTRYRFPDCGLLKKYNAKPVVDMEEINANNRRIVEVLSSFGVRISKINATVGPTITLYEITPAEGVRISRIRGLEADIALSLSALGIRIIAPIPGKGTIGIEVPNQNPQIVSMESVLNTRKFQNTHMALPMALGKTITNEVFMVDLAKIPHLLVAGATGQGKSVGLNAIITSLLYKKHPNELKFVLVDPKKVEFSIYNKIAPHYMASLPENEEEPIITDVQKVVRTLNSLCVLMDHRYDLLKRAQVKKIDEYNDKFVHHLLNPADGHGYMPYIVVIIDEFGDLIMTAGKEIELPIARIAQLARAVGIHMIIATQRPTTKIITGNIKANFPGRMAFRVTAQIDSRTILDRSGAEQLVGKGDLLFLAGGEPVRVQCAFIDTPEIERINDFIARQPGPVDPMELPEPQDDNHPFGADGNATEARNLDPLFDEAAHAIVITQQGSTSMIQRRFSIGYNRAGRLMDQLQAAGIVGEAQGSKPREVLIADENSLSTRLAQIHGT